MHRESAIFLMINLVLPWALSMPLRALPVAQGQLALLFACAALIAALNFARARRARVLKPLYWVILPANLLALWLTGTLAAMTAALRLAPMLWQAWS
ncbi:hypothetical protein [Thioclava pacifica]|uniref:Uncharacterized protein n=1 Tax=Thioclava pacifica DSM 10166 TaxID=1353537 RepID=A0A074JAF0_9RHOB|nr:hypothetical protein [Thioclava pacifica]KEO52820.1 hypothetical protein TP2_07720 [Thioclava pacifica DSM 10166]